jgi:hypothetical protein
MYINHFHMKHISRKNRRMSRTSRTSRKTKHMKTRRIQRGGGVIHFDMQGDAHVIDGHHYKIIENDDDVPPKWMYSGDVKAIVAPAPPGAKFPNQRMSWMVVAFLRISMMGRLQCMRGHM